MKKVLIIGYPFPLRRGGSPRLLGLAKYLPEFGWQPIILSAPLDMKPGPTLRVIETPCPDSLHFWKRLLRLREGEDIRIQVKKRLGVKKKKSALDFMLTRIGEVVNYPDADKGWRPYATRAGKTLLDTEDIDAIISSSAPITAHLVAKELKLKHQTPWLADLRDLWSQNHNYSYSRLRKLFDERLERSTLSMADALVTVSKPWADKLEALHAGKTVHTITNGFDLNEVNNPPGELTPKFTITYTGTIYARQDPSKLFAALCNLIKEGTLSANDIDIRFYGEGIGWLDREIEHYRLSNVAKQYGSVPRSIAIEKQRESQLLLCFKWEDSQEHGAYPGKLFEYLGARRPILATGGTDDVVNDLLNETGAGISAMTLEDIKNMLNEFYEDYKRSGSVPYKGKESEISKYSHRELARQLCGILDSIT